MFLSYYFGYANITKKFNNVVIQKMYSSQLAFQIHYEQDFIENKLPKIYLKTEAIRLNSMKSYRNTMSLTIVSQVAA